jgi:hypothetical protein
MRRDPDWRIHTHVVCEVVMEGRIRERIRRGDWSQPNFRPETIKIRAPLLTATTPGPQPRVLGFSAICLGINAAVCLLMMVAVARFFQDLLLPSRPQLSLLHLVFLVGIAGLIANAVRQGFPDWRTPVNVIVCMSILATALQALKLVRKRHSADGMHFGNHAQASVNMVR